MLHGPATDKFPGAKSAAGGRRLAVARLTLTDFRCYRGLRLECGTDPVVLTGPNGAGKTNLLEAISFLVPGRGLRRARSEDIAWRPVGGVPADAWAVAARLETPDGPHDVGTGRHGAESRDRRRVRIDGQAARGQAALAEILSAVWLTPQMDRLFVDGASVRRRFLDRLVYGFDPAHAGRVAAYEHALRERTRLLRDGCSDSAWLAALEETMAERGVAVAASRQELVGRLASKCADGSGPFPGATLDVTGDIEGWLDDGPALDAEDRLRAALAEARTADAETGGAAAGPHRSDLTVRHAATGRPAAECSTGEQKALLIATVLASARLQAEERGSVPVLLLDEVAAHLDVRHRETLFDEVAALGAQVWYTGTDKALFAPLVGRARFFDVEAAAVKPSAAAP